MASFVSLATLLSLSLHTAAKQTKQQQHRIQIKFIIKSIKVCAQ